MSQLKISPNTKFQEVFTDELNDFLIKLHRNFNHTRIELLEERKKTQLRFDSGELPSFPSETIHIRNGEWTCGETPKDLLDRRVEITGPVDRKMIINALNSGANTFMADFEDSNSPTWENCIQGQINLTDAINRNIDFTNEQGKSYKLNDEIATLIVRPRGLHLSEKNIEIEDELTSASLMDFGIFLEMLKL